MVSTPYRPQYVVAAAWSTTRPSVFYSIGSEGSYEAWDILRSHKTPVLSASVADAPLTAMAVEVAQSAGLQAVGTADGTTVVVRPSGSLMHATEDESTAVSTMFERECGRERALEKAEKEAKGRARKDAARAAEPVTRVTEEDLQKVRNYCILFTLRVVTVVALQALMSVRFVWVCSWRRSFWPGWPLETLML